MIAHVKGMLEAINGDHIVVECGGIGYEIYYPGPMQSDLPLCREQCTILIKMIVREDDISLFGFDSHNRKKLFELLLTVSGVGPKSAMGIASSMPTSTIVSAIAGEDALLLTKIPGVGKKSAERIVLELKEKIIKALPEESIAGVVSPSGVLAVIYEEVESALLALGYSGNQVKFAISQLRCNEAVSVEDAIRLSLNILSSGR